MISERKLRSWRKNALKLNLVTKSETDETSKLLKTLSNQIISLTSDLMDIKLLNEDEK